MVLMDWKNALLFCLCHDRVIVKTGEKHVVMILATLLPRVESGNFASSQGTRLPVCKYSHLLLS